VREDTSSELCHALSACAGTVFVFVLYGNFPLSAVGSGFAPCASRAGQNLMSAASLCRVRLLSSAMCLFVRVTAGCSCSCLVPECLLQFSSVTSQAASHLDFLFIVPC